MKLSENLNRRLNDKYFEQGHMHYPDVFWYGVAESFRRFGL